MNLTQYAPEQGFSKQDIERGLHTLFMDTKCPWCGKEQTVANTGFIGGPCIRCGKRTDGSTPPPVAAKEADHDA